MNKKIKKTKILLGRLHVLLTFKIPDDRRRSVYWTVAKTTKKNRYIVEPDSNFTAFHSLLDSSMTMRISIFRHMSMTPDIHALRFAFNHGALFFYIYTKK